MRTRRRRAPTGDGLDLLLDTVCNTFGGVVFIAILMAILLESSTPHPHEPTDSSEVAREQLLLELQSTTHQLAELKAAVNSQQALISQFSTAELREKIEQRNRLQSQRDSSQEELDRQQAGNRQQQMKLTQQQQSLVEMRQSKEAARTRQQELEKQIRQEQLRRRRQVRMPVIRSGDRRREVGLILRYGRMYVWHRWSADGDRLGLNADDFIVVGEESDGLVTTPKPTGGIALDDRPETATQIQQRLRIFRPEDFVMAVIVRPDSYGHFRHLREVLKTAGFQYRLMPMSKDSAVRDRGGSGGQVQ